MPLLGAVGVAVGFETQEFSNAPDQVSFFEAGRALQLTSPLEYV